jgi:hypothetical protein
VYGGRIRRRDAYKVQIEYMHDEWDVRDAKMILHRCGETAGACGMV